MKKIEAKIVADSINQQGDRITTYLLTFPRFILAELNTHRVFSKNSASSRAIPFEKMVKMVQEDPFIPIAWQKNHKGMQGNEYWIDDDTVTVDEGDEYERYTKIYSATEHFITKWLEARDLAIAQSYELNRLGVTKQLCNRLLEPFMWHTVLLTGTEFKNFFELRCPLYQTPVSQTVEPQYSWKDLEEVHSNPINLEILENNRDNYTFKFQHSKGNAEIHMQALAEAMWDAYNESTPKELKEGEWHIPFGDKIQLAYTDYDFNGIITNEGINKKLKISTARCARLSYMTFDGEIDYEKDLKLHDTLLESHHMSPFEHCARAMTQDEYYLFVKGKADALEDNIDYCNITFNNPPKNTIGWCRNFKGFIQYRHFIENYYDGFRM